MRRFLLLPLLLALSSCNFFNTAKQPSVDVSSVTDVHVSGNILLKITHATESKLEIQASDAVLAELIIDMQGSKLEIKDRYKPTHDPVIVTLSISELQYVNASGAIKGQIDGLKTNDFTLKCSGSVDMVLAGTTDHCNIAASGSFQIDATKLLSNSMNVHGSGSGSILYQGNPVIKKSLSGNIQLTQK